MIMLHPKPELPDDIQIEFPTRIRNALNAAGLKTVGEVRESSDETLLSLPDLGQGSVRTLRATLGLPSCHGLRAEGNGKMSGPRPAGRSGHVIDAVWPDGVTQ
jgi:DNA-directed RNA polymerase alpha subunit